jgi:hypothetical protein
MSTLRKWTEDEEKVIISKIEEDPNNLQRAFREASLEIGRTPTAIEYRWYQGGLRERSGKFFMAYRRKGTLNSNRKNVSSNTSDNTINTIRTRKSKWRRVLDILFE